jgi:hypothetical protein
MSDASTRRLISMYVEEATAPMFLSGFFRSPPENYHNSEKVEIDVIRDDEKIAIPVQDLTVGYRENESTQYVNKAFTPPIFKEAGSIHAYNLLKRQPGNDPFEDPTYGAAATAEAFRIFRRLEAKIRRSVELMAAQVLQTGKLELTDETGAVLYVLDFLPKATHMATVSTTWALDGSTGNPLGDLEAMADVTRQDGRQEPSKAIFGSSAWARFLANAKVKDALGKLGYGLGELSPQTRGKGASYQGKIALGGYIHELWTYNGQYKHPQTGAMTRYLDTDNVLMLSPDGRLDLSWGGMPLLVRPESRVLPFLPERISDGAAGIDLNTNAWVTPNGEHLMVSASARPLTIPTAIDTFARLNVTT